ncbi:MAG: redoxin domain-containing protein [bacterium]|nr:redoxin domain-containing protein [bacterium]
MEKKNIFVTVAIVGIMIVISAILYRSIGKQPAETANNNNAGTIAATTSEGASNSLLNKPAPDFSLADRTGKTYSPESLRGKNIILFFNEGLMCYPSCWNQIVELSKDERFKNTDIVALSVVVDSPEEWQSAISKMPELAKAIVVFDKGGAISQKFGMLTTPSSMHYGMLPGHSYILIDKQGIVRHFLDDPNMGIHNDQLVEQINKFN